MQAGAAAVRVRRWLARRGLGRIFAWVRVKGRPNLLPASLKRRMRDLKKQEATAPLLDKIKEMAGW